MLKRIHISQLPMWNIHRSTQLNTFGFNSKLLYFEATAVQKNHTLKVISSVDLKFNSNSAEKKYIIFRRWTINIAKIWSNIFTSSYVFLFIINCCVPYNVYLQKQLLLGWVCLHYNHLINLAVVMRKDAVMNELLVPCII